MKIKELKGLIREAVKKTLLEAGYDQYGEGFYSMESAGGSSVEDKMEQAVDIAVDAAETLSRMDRYDHMEVDLATDKAVSKIVRLFLDPNGDFSDGNADPDEMAQAMHDMLSMRVDRSEENLAVFDHADKLILKALNKLRMMEESVLAEALYEKHVGFKNLVKKLQGQGKSEKSAKAIAYSIGKKKYGKEKMAKAAASGKQLSDKEALDEITQSLMGVSVGATEEDLARKIAQYIADGANGMKAVVTALSRNSDFDKLIPTLNIEGIRQMMLSYDDLRPSPREVEEAVGILQSFKEEGLDETALAEAPPVGWHGTVRAMKTHGHTGKGGIDNPYALAHYMANKGDEPHYKEQPSSKRGTPKKKKGQ